MEVKLEYLGEDQSFEGSKVWKVEAIHVTTTRNKRKFTQAELEVSARSLSFRPLNINHERNQQLTFPDNATLAMNFNAESMAVEGSFRVADPTINALIESGRIKQVSIEQIPTAGEDCTSNVSCEQHGVAFIGMALLESDVLPGDPNANIKLESLFVSDEQRSCPTCTDFEMCDKCSHNGHELRNNILLSTLREMQGNHPDWPRNKIIAMSLSKLGKDESNKEEAWKTYRECKALFEVIDQQMQVCLEDIQQTHPELSMEERITHCMEILNRVKDGSPPETPDNNITINVVSPSS